MTKLGLGHVRELALLAVVMLLFVNSIGVLPQSPIVEPRVLQKEQYEPPFSATKNTPVACSSISSVYGSPIVSPTLGTSIQGSGAGRSAWLYWNNSQIFTDCNNISDVEVSNDKGLMSRETLNFTQIQAHNLTVVVEDYNPSSAPDNEYITNYEYIYMGFRIYGTELVRLDGFWVYLHGESSGLVSYRVYTADPYSSYTRPDLFAPIGPLMQTTIPTIPPGSEGWVWLDADETTLLVDPSATEQNTFYLGLWRGLSSTVIRWTYVHDASSPDNDDEGDAWRGSSVSGWSWTYHTRDYFLNVSIAPFIQTPNPSDINLQVNSSTVLNQILPGTGWWDSGKLEPPINMTEATRKYDITLLWPDFYQWPVTFDIIWQASFLNLELASTTFQTWSMLSEVDWNITLDAQFSSGAFDKIINITIEEDWNVLSVFLESTLHSTWTEDVDYILISNADDGIWHLLCEAPNYVTSVEVLNPENTTTTQANSTSLVTIRGYVSDTSARNVTNGNGYLSVYDPDGTLNFTDSSSVVMPPGGIVDVQWRIWETAQKPGNYTLHIAWTNGTEAGENTTMLSVWFETTLDIVEEIPPMGESVIRGEIIEVIVNYTDFLGNPLDNATISVMNETSSTEWNEWNAVNLKETDPIFAGLYYITLMTENASINVLHNITIHLFQPYYLEQNYEKSILILGRKTHILPLSGLDNNTSIWRTSPEPLINDTELQFTIQYHTDHGIPIAFAQITATLHWAPYSRNLEIEELSQLGCYNITVDTTPIQGITFHVGDEPFIQIHASKQGYEEAVSPQIYLRPQPREAFLDISTEQQHIHLYTNWTYVAPLRVVLRDSITSEDLPNGNVIAEFPSIGIVELEKAIPDFGIYEIQSLDTSLITLGTHLIVLEATIEDYLPANYTITLTTLPKHQIESRVELIPQPLQLFVGFQFQPYFLQGSVLTLTVYFTTETDTPLPEDTTVILDIWAGTENLPSIPLIPLDQTGKFTFQCPLDIQTTYTFYVSITESETLEGLKNIELEMPKVNVIHPLTYLLPWILLAFFVAVCAHLGYLQFIIIPKRRLHNQQLTVISDTFTNVEKIIRLLVLEKKTGLCLYDPFVDVNMDANLIAGFLQALSSFGSDLAEVPGMEEKELKISSLRELSYEGFNILIQDGELIRSALVLSGASSEQLRSQLAQFTHSFEERFQNKLKKWEGRLHSFDEAGVLMEDYFHISLRLPHRIAPQQQSSFKLSDLEKRVLKIAKEFGKARDYFFLKQILNAYLAASKEDKLDVLMAIYQLHQKEVLVPWDLQTTFSTRNATDPITPRNDN